MASMRKPKCITIRGHDQNEYKYLVKGGEDLRQDQRIEQVTSSFLPCFLIFARSKKIKLSLRNFLTINKYPVKIFYEIMLNY